MKKVIQTTFAILFTATFFVACNNAETAKSDLSTTEKTTTQPTAEVNKDSSVSGIGEKLETTKANEKTEAKENNEVSEEKESNKVNEREESKENK